MGLGSLDTSPFRDLGARMMTDRNHHSDDDDDDGGEGEAGREGEGGVDPPAKKQKPRLAPSCPADVPGARPTQGRGAGVDVPRPRPRGSGDPFSAPFPHTRDIHEDVLPERAAGRASSVDKDLKNASPESREAARLAAEAEEVVGDCCGRRGGGDGEKFLSSSSSCSFSTSSSSSSSSVLCAGAARRQRSFIPESRKDQTYWEKRRKNNEAARKSREKRRLHDQLLENRIADLEEDNHRLRVELHRLKNRYGIPLDLVFMGQDRAGTIQDDPSPPVGLCGQSAPGDEREELPGLMDTPPSPPLLALSTTTALPAAAVEQMFPPQASSFHFFMPTVKTELPTDLSSSARTVAYPPIPPAHQQGSAVVIKREPEDDGTGPHTSFLKQANHQAERTPEYRDLCLRYASGSPQGTSLFSAAGTVMTADWRWCETAPPRPPCERAAPHWGRRSPLSSHSSEDTADEPLQLTVHNRGSRADSLEDDSGSDGAKDRSCNTDGRFSPPFSLPVKLRHKMPLDVCPPQLVTSGVVSSGTGGPSPVHGSLIVTGEPCQVDGLRELREGSFIQESPLPLVKKEPQPLSQTSPPRGHAARDRADLKYLDPKYLERRRRNNEAARKCRQNRRNLTRLWEAKSDHLQSENGQLRVELGSLQEEMKQLKQLMDNQCQELSQHQQTL